MTDTYLLDEHIREIVAFDCKRRNGIERKKPTRKTLRYNYIIHESAKGRGDAPRSEDGGKNAAARNHDGRGDVIVLHVAVRLNRYYQPVVKDVNAFFTRTGTSRWRDYSYHRISGWCVAWKDVDYNGSKKDIDKEYLVGRGVWEESVVPWKYGRGDQFPYHETVNVSALKGTRFEYCQYADNGTGKTGLIDWLMLYRQEPKIEYLAKAGWYALITPMGIKTLKDKAVFEYVREHGDEVRRLSGSFWGPRKIVYAARHGVTINAAVRHFNFAKNVSYCLDPAKSAAIDKWREKTGEYGLPARMRIRIDYARLEKCFSRWRIDVQEYTRYLEYAIKSGLDWKNEGTLYPPVKGGRKAFMARLEALEKEAARLRRKQAREKRERMKALFAERAVEIEAFQESLERTKTLTGCGYRIVLAKTQEDLRQEGRKMRNCVGMGCYGEGIVAGDRLIVMLKDSSGRSYCDIEIERRHWTVRQCYLKCNKCAPDEIRALAVEIAAALKEQWKRMKSKKGKAA